MAISVLTDDVERMFGDWGLPALLLEVDRAYDPASGAIAEASYGTPCTVIATSSVAEPMPGGAANVPVLSRSYLLRAGDVAGLGAVTSLRLRCEQRLWSVVSCGPASLAELLRLECVEMFEPECAGPQEGL